MLCFSLTFVAHQKVSKNLEKFSPKVYNLKQPVNNVYESTTVNIQHAENNTDHPYKLASFKRDLK